MHVCLHKRYERRDRFQSPAPDGHCSVAIVVIPIMLRHTYASDAGAIQSDSQQGGTIRNDTMESGLKGRPGRPGSLTKIVQNLLATPLCICAAPRPFSS